MQCGKIRNLLGNLRHKGALSNAPGRYCPIMFILLLKCRLSVHHPQHTIWQVKLVVLVYYLLQDALPSLQFLVLDPLKEIHFTVPGHWPGCELVLTGCCLGKSSLFNQSIRNRNSIGHDLLPKPFESFLALFFSFFHHSLI